MAISWQEIKDISSGYWCVAMELYDDSFPIEVREPHDVFVRSIEQGKVIAPSTYHFLVGLDENDQLAGFAAAHYLSEVNFGFIVYIVVNPSLRGQGTGAKLLRQVEFLLEQDAKKAHQKSLQGILLETEKEEIVHTDEDRQDCIKRNLFFSKQGYVLMQNVLYLQPPLHPADHTCVPLNLFVKMLSQVGALSETELRRIVSAIYKEKYGRMNLIPQSVLEECENKLQIDSRSKI